MSKDKKQKWQPGQKVSIGGREYVVKHQEEHAPKGVARAWVIATADGTRTYRWRPFRGLELVSSKDGSGLIRPRVRVKKPKGVTPPAPAPAGGLTPAPGLLGVIVEDIRQHPRPGTTEFLTKVLGYFGVSLQSDAPQADVQDAQPAGKSS